MTLQVKLLDLLVSLVQTFWFNVYWLVYIFSVLRMYVYLRVFVYFVYFQRPGCCQYSSSLLWWCTLALHLFSFIKSIDCYFFFLKKKVAHFSFLKRIDFSSAQNWVFMSFMKYFIGSKLGYLYFVKRIDYWLVQNLSIYLLFVNRCKKIGSFGPRSDHSLSMSAHWLKRLLNDLTLWPKNRDNHSKHWLFALNIQIFGSKLHIFVPSSQFEPYRSMFAVLKHVSLTNYIWRSWAFPIAES